VEFLFRIIFTSYFVKVLGSCITISHKMCYISTGGWGMGGGLQMGMHPTMGLVGGSVLGAGSGLRGRRIKDREL
jgi:hypothetical protein